MSLRPGEIDMVSSMIRAAGLSAEARGANGVSYYVSGNYGRDTNSGLSWDSPFKTLAHAFAVSHANIAANSKGWAARNTVFVSGDTFVEDLLAFPQKTDVVGVGSDDGFSMAGITGNHVPAIATANAYKSTGTYGAQIGTRFFNIRFLTVAAGIIVDLTSACSGVQFIGCLFDATGAATATTAIRATASPYLKVLGCKCEGAFATSYITFGTGDALGTEIRDNIMSGAAAGGILTGAATTASYMGVIDRNTVQAVGKVIDTQATSVFLVTNNTFVSTAALGSSSFVLDLTFAANNVITGNDVSRSIPFITIA